MLFQKIQCVTQYVVQERPKGLVGIVTEV